MAEGTLPDDSAAAHELLAQRADEGYNGFLDNIWHDPAHPNEMRSLDDIPARATRASSLAFNLAPPSKTV